MDVTIIANQTIRSIQQDILHWLHDKCESLKRKLINFAIHDFSFSEQDEIIEGKCSLIFEAADTKCEGKTIYLSLSLFLFLFLSFFLFLTFSLFLFLYFFSSHTWINKHWIHALLKSSSHACLNTYLGGGGCLVAIWHSM